MLPKLGPRWNAHQTMQMMEPFNVGRKTTTVFLVDLDIVLGKTGFVSIFGRDSHGSNYQNKRHTRINGVKEQYLQSVPSDSHAASTSGLASWRKIFSFRNDPLNCCSW